jgi:hypothetical protein
MAVRLLYSPPEGAPHKIATAPHLAQEGDIPYFAAWSDGSIYMCYRLNNRSAVREYVGPLFGEKKWHKEKFDT